jgi:hypothetical protein
MNQMFSLHKDEAVYSRMSLYGLGKMGKLIASTAKLKTARCRMAAGVPSW